MREDVAIVVGGSERVMDDLAAARMLAHAAGLPVTLYATNDAIAVLEDPIVAVTLHPAKLGLINTRTVQHRGWLAERAERGYPAPAQVWSIQMAPGITNVTEDWGGSSGLYAVKIAHFMCGHDRVLLAGVPMTVENCHFMRRGQRWNACHAFRRGWTHHKKEIAPYVRSMSGWTAAEYGAPTDEWLRPEVLTAAC